MAVQGGVDVQGADRLVRTLGAATRNLGDLETAHRATADQAMAVSRATAPRRTGRLAASGSTSAGPGQGVLTFGAPYAGVIHYGWRTRNIIGRPFAWRALDRNLTQPVAYTSALDRVLSKVKGV